MIYLVRHGLDDERYIGGYSDISLIKEGIEQIIRTRDYIIDNKLPIKKIYSSDIKRAKETTDIINEKLQKEVTYLNKLREQDKGLLTGLKKVIAYTKYPEFTSVNNPQICYPNGESLQDLYNRIVIFLEELTEDEILLVTHRGVINMIYYILTSTPLDMNKEKFNVTHGSIHELDIHKKKIRKLYGD